MEMKPQGRIVLDGLISKSKRRNNLAGIGLG